jgi:pimeloyl-ACP methyl ester carboxylesterase
MPARTLELDRLSKRCGDVVAASSPCQSGRSSVRNPSLLLATGLLNLTPAEPELAPSARKPGWRIVRRLLMALVALVLIAGIGYTAYVGVVGSETFVHPTGNTDCRTPMVRYGWAYAAINYDIADDTVLENTNPDMENCSSQGTSAGTEVVTSDGARIAGWYIPAANGAGPTGPTVVLVHGWAANKSEVLKYAAAFHATYNVVAFDLRGGGRSSRTEVTFGLREKLDLEAVIDWLQRTKHPSHIAVMGNSMGAATAVLAAVRDQRIEALILDSMHARVEDVVGRRLEVDEGQPSLPGTAAILFGVWVRTGLNLMDANPIDAIPTLGHRPILFIHGTGDLQDLPWRSVYPNYNAARAAGIPAELHMCEGARHGYVIDTCPDDWARWSVDFLGRALH